MRQSVWNANSRTNKLNLVPRAYDKEKDIGWTFGGPIGKLGHADKLFFFYSHEFDPRKLTLNSSGVANYRLPSALERNGDFSQSTDNNGNPYPYIKDPLSTNPCSATNTTGCFADGSVLGRIPANRVYGLGLKILSLYPMPNLTTPGLNYNYQGILPSQSVYSQAPIVKLDYQPWAKLHTSSRFSYWSQPNDIVKGTLPGINDSRVYQNWDYNFASTTSYTINPTTFIEATFGQVRGNLSGCLGPENGAAPTLCTSAIPTDTVASLSGADTSDWMVIPTGEVICPSRVRKPVRWRAGGSG